MKAVILAAGEGKRLKPFTETMPKVMLPIANKPILEYVFDACKRNGVEELIVVVGYKKEVIMEYFHDYQGIKITFIEQKNQLGTAHALSTAKSYIDQPFIVLPGDNIIDDVSIAHLLNNPDDYILLIKEHHQPSKYGVVEVKDQYIQSIIEKPKKEASRFISTGIYKFPPTIFNLIEELQHQGSHALTPVIQTLLEKETKIHAIFADHWMDIVYPWDIIRANESILQQMKMDVIQGTIEEGVTVKGPVFIGKNTKIYAGCYLIGPISIGEGCEIGPNTCIFPSTVIGNNSVVNAFSELRNSVVFSNVHIGSHASIAQTIIGQSTQIQNNFSSMSGETTIEDEGEYVKLTDMGSIIGEDTTIKSHVVIDPGIIIGRAVHINSMKHINVPIPSKSKVM